MARQPAWVRKLNEACEKAALAGTYFDDGAYLTAADRLEEAAKLMREGHAARTAHMNRLYGVE